MIMFMFPWTVNQKIVGQSVGKLVEHISYPINYNGIDTQNIGVFLIPPFVSMEKSLFPSNPYFCWENAMHLV